MNLSVAQEVILVQAPVPEVQIGSQNEDAEQISGNKDAEKISGNENANEVRMNDNNNKENAVENGQFCVPDNVKVILLFLLIHEIRIFKKIILNSYLKFFI